MCHFLCICYNLIYIYFMRVFSKNKMAKEIKRKAILFVGGSFNPVHTQHCLTYLYIYLYLSVFICDFC